MKKPTVVLADDHGIILDGVRRVLEDHVTIVATCTDGESLIQAARTLHPDIVITDMSMPRLGGLQALRTLRREGTSPRVIMLTMYTEDTLVKSAMLSGADGYVPKHAAGEELLDAINKIMEGGTYISPLVDRQRRTPTLAAPQALAQLSRRQREVLRLVAQGKRMKEIAADLQLSSRTVEMHKYTTMRALNVRTTAELIQYYVKNELATGAATGGDSFHGDPD